MVPPGDAGRRHERREKDGNNRREDNKSNETVTAEDHPVFSDRCVAMMLTCAFGCAHGNSAFEPSSQDQLFLAAAKYTFLHLADPDINPDTPSTWGKIVFCLRVNDLAPSPSLLQELTRSGFQVSADMTACTKAEPPGRIVNLFLGDLKGNDATIRSGVMWGEGGILDLHWDGRLWIVTAIRNRWVS